MSRDCSHSLLPRLQMHAVACTKVPKITVVTGGSTGEGYYAMAGRPMQPSFMFLWPGAHVAAVPKAHVEQLAKQLLEVEAAKVDTISNERKRARASKLLKFRAAQVESMCTSVYSSARLWDDGIIPPSDTRKLLAQALAAVSTSPAPRSSGFGVFRV